MWCIVIITYQQLELLSMLNNALKVSFKKDVEFSGWSDILDLKCDRKIGYNRVIAEAKIVNSNKKVCLVAANGMRIRFMQGNKILKDFYWCVAVKNPNFENLLSEFTNQSFADARKVFRSIMFNLSQAL